jgi:hypothetical protein
MRKERCFTGPEEPIRVADLRERAECGDPVAIARIERLNYQANMSLVRAYLGALAQATKPIFQGGR